MKILIAESIDEKILEEFKNSGLDFTYKPNISIADLENELASYNGLIVRPKEVTSAAIAHSANLKIIIRGGAGVNSIALDECKKRGVIVANTPGLNSDATAEFTFHLLLSIIKASVPSTEVKGKSLGIIGYGNIGKRVEKIASGFGMEVSIFKRGDNLHKFLKTQHDVISLHLPLSKETENLLGSNEFKLMKRGVIIINTARPQLINAEAFKAALDAGIIKSFGIDGDDDLIEPFTDPRGITTPHIADATAEAQRNITRAALTQMVEFFVNGKEINRVL
jgi:D-3-phosphoglycerate dehydrogenase